MRVSRQRRAWSSLEARQRSREEKKEEEGSRGLFQVGHHLLGRAEAEDARPALAGAMDHPAAAAAAAPPRPLLRGWTRTTSAAAAGTPRRGRWSPGRARRPSRPSRHRRSRRPPARRTKSSCFCRCCCSLGFGCRRGLRRQLGFGIRVSGCG